MRTCDDGYMDCRRFEAGKDRCGEFCYATVCKGYQKQMDELISRRDKLIEQYVALGPNADPADTRAHLRKTGSLNERIDHFRNLLAQS